MNYETTNVLGILESTLTEIESGEYAAEQMSDFEQEVVFAIVEAATDPNYMAPIINYMTSQIRNDYALEGATKESIKMVFGDDMKEAKEDLRDAKNLIKDGKYREAEEKVKQARAGFVKCHETLAKVKQGPISMITASFVSLVLSVINIFKSFKDVSISAKAALVSKTLGGIIGSIASLLPGVSVVQSIVKSIVSEIPGAINLSFMTGNKFHKIKKDPDSSEDEKLSNKAGAFNDAQMQILALLKFYITTCDGIIKDIHKMKNENQ